MSVITQVHASRLANIREALINMEPREHVFINAENYFYEVISIARCYGDDITTNKLLLSLKQLEANEYRHTQAIFNKRSQREQVIKRFISHFISILKKAPLNLAF